MKKIAVFGIHTDVGKTLISAFLVESLQADYWKPVQTGSIYGTDKQTVQALIANTKSLCFDEIYCFETPVSPHKAARLEQSTIELERLQVPSSSNTLIIETAGGVHSPMNETSTMLDVLAPAVDCCVLVVKDYLGCINHTLMSINEIQNKGLDLKLVMYSGEIDADTKDFITNYYPHLKQFHFPYVPNITPQALTLLAQRHHSFLQQTLLES